MRTAAQMNVHQRILSWKVPFSLDEHYCLKDAVSERLTVNWRMYRPRDAAELAPPGQPSWRLSLRGYVAN